MKNRHHLRLPLLCAWTLLAVGCSPDIAPDEEGIPSLETPPAHLSAATSVGPLDVDLKTYRAACDGKTDDRAAFVAAFTALSKAGGGTLRIPAGNCRVKMLSWATWLIIPSNVTVRGIAGASRITLDADATVPEQFRALFSIDNPNVTLEDLELVRAAQCSSVLIRVPPTTNFTMRRVTLDGQRTEAGPSVHGVMLVSGEAGKLHRNLRMEQCTVRNLEYGLLQASETTTDISGIVVTGSSFEGNFADDLEFNAPSGVMTDVEVSDSTFRNNRSSDGGRSGFGVGLANVQGAEIRNNTFDGYRYEPVHIEAASSDVLVEGNTFTRGFMDPTPTTSWRSHVFIISGSHHVTVRGNHFDMSANTLDIQAIFASRGGDSTVSFPHDLLIEQNTFVPGLYGRRSMVAWVPNVIQRDNRVYVSDMPWVSRTNGVGPPERDQSNGAGGAADGHPITLAGVQYTKGVGVHAASELVINLGGQYERFKAHIGVDDSMGGAGSVVFSVYADGESLFQSGTLKGTSATQVVDVNVTGKQELRLLVGNAGDGGTCDHGDWADARLE